MSLAALLSDVPITKDYESEPQITATGSGFTSLIRYPAFSLSFIPEMMRDPRIRLGLELIIGPILAKARFLVDSENDEVREYVQTTLEMIWGGIDGRRVLTSMIYGYACSETLWEYRNGQIHFKELKPLHPLHCRYVKNNRTGNHVGAVVSIQNSKGNQGRVLLLGAKCFWSTHCRDFSTYYGQSRLFNAHIPWIEKWCDGGFRDSRRLFFMKQAFGGGTMYHPPGFTNTILDPSTGAAKPERNSDIARRMIEQLRTGGTLYIPRVNSANAQLPAWEFVPGEVSPAPQGLLDYGKDLDDELWQGMGILPEVISAPETGNLGNGGRAIPMDGFYSILHGILCEAASDVVRQIVHPGVILNFGRDNSHFTVKPYGLLRDNEDVDTNPELTNEPGAVPSSGEKQGAAMSGSLAPYQHLRQIGRLRKSFAIRAGGSNRYGE